MKREEVKPLKRAPQDVAKAEKLAAKDSEKEDRKAKKVKKFDTLRLVRATAMLILGFYTTIVGCMLSLFVPQACGLRNVAYNDTHAPPACGQSPYIQGDYVSQNYFYFVFAWNIITAVTVYCHHAVIWQREQLMLRRLQEDPATAFHRLPGLLPYYPKTSSLLYLAHERSIVATVVFIIIWLINVCASIVLCYYRYAGTQTVTVFITNNLVLCTLLYESLRALIPALRYNLALSAFFVRPVNYNVLDMKYVDPRDPTKGGRIEEEDPETGRDKPVPEFRHLPMPKGTKFKPEPFDKKGEHTPLTMNEGEPAYGFQGAGNKKDGKKDSKPEKKAAKKADEEDGN